MPLGISYSQQAAFVLMKSMPALGARYAYDTHLKQQIYHRH